MKHSGFRVTGYRRPRNSVNGMGKYIMTAGRTSRAACWWFILKKVLNGKSCHAAEGVKGKQGSDALSRILIRQRSILETRYIGDRRGREGDRIACL